MRQNEIKGFVSLAISGFLYSLYGIYSRMMGNTFAPFYQAWSRTIINVIILFFIIYIFKKWRKLNKKDFVWFAFIGTFGGLIDVLFFISVLKLSIGTTLFLFYAFSTVFSYLWGKIFFKEKVTRIKFVSIMFALLGTFLLYWGQVQFSPSDIVYLFIASLAGVGVSVYTTFNKKISDHYSPFQIAGVSNVIGFPILFVFSLFFKESWYLSFISLPWLTNLLFSLTQIIITVLIVYGFKFIEVQKGSLILLLELVFGVVWGITLYHEIPSSTILFGGILILLALSLPLFKFDFSRKR